jgi:hypothetical protein
VNPDIIRVVPGDRVEILGHLVIVEGAPGGVAARLAARHPVLAGQGVRPRRRTLRPAPSLVADRTALRHRRPVGRGAGFVNGNEISAVRQTVVVEIEFLRGKGVALDDPVRRVKRYYELDGTLLAENDPYGHDPLPKQPTRFPE